jgi:hypothetical protein
LLNNRPDEENKMRTLKLAAAFAAAMLTVPVAHAAQATFPEKPIRLVLGSAPASASLSMRGPASPAF